MKKNIGIIVRGLTVGGVKRFVKNILNEFDQNIDYNFFVFTDSLEFENDFKNLKFIYIKKRSLIWFDYIRLPFVINKYQLDWLIYPKNIIPFTHTFLKARKINIIHDLAYFHKQIGIEKTTTFGDRLYMRLFMGLSCKIANKVSTISQNTKNDIVKILKIPADKIVVVYEGVEKNFFYQENVEVLSKYKINKPYIFYPGSLLPRKNIFRLLQAFLLIKDQIPHNLYLSGYECAGDKKLGSNKLMKFIQDNNLSDRVKFFGYIVEEDLPVIYSGADLCVYPSLYEGFGLPILEAQACRCPLLTSDTSSCSEVAGLEAKVVNPYSVEEISQVIVEILVNNTQRESLVVSGLKNLERYSWQNTVVEILKICI